MFSKSSFSRNRKRSYGSKRSFSSSRPRTLFKKRPYTSPTGNDVSKFTCKVIDQVYLYPHVDAEGHNVLGYVYGLINVWGYLAKSPYAVNIRQLYDEVRINSCSVKTILKASTGDVTQTRPSFVYKAAWDRNGITYSNEWNLVPTAGQYASNVIRSGNFYAPFMSSHTISCSSLGEKAQYIATKHLGDSGLCWAQNTSDPRFGTYDPTGMYASQPFKPVLLVQMECDQISGGVYQVEIAYDITCRGIKVLDGSQTSQRVPTATDEDVRRGVPYQKPDGTVSVGEMIIVDPQNLELVDQPLGGNVPIQIGIPGVKYDGACTITLDVEPDEPNTNFFPLNSVAAYIVPDGDPHTPPESMSYGFISSHLSVIGWNGGTHQFAPGFLHAIVIIPKDPQYASRSYFSVMNLSNAGDILEVSSSGLYYSAEHYNYWGIRFAMSVAGDGFMGLYNVEGAAAAPSQWFLLNKTSAVNQSWAACIRNAVNFDSRVVKIAGINA